jgi:hypothetical protein
MSQCSDVLLVELMCAGLGVQVSLVRMLEGLPGAFVSGQVIFFSVMLGASAMGVGRKVVVLGSDLL